MAFTRFYYICIGKSNSSYYSKNDINFCQFVKQQLFILPSLVILHLNQSKNTVHAVIVGVRE